MLCQKIKMRGKKLFAEEKKLKIDLNKNIRGR